MGTGACSCRDWVDWLLTADFYRGMDMRTGTGACPYD